MPGRAEIFGEAGAGTVEEDAGGVGVAVEDLGDLIGGHGFDVVEPEGGEGVWGEEGLGGVPELAAHFGGLGIGEGVDVGGGFEGWDGVEEEEFAAAGFGDGETVGDGEEPGGEGEGGVVAVEVAGGGEEGILEEIFGVVMGAGATDEEVEEGGLEAAEEFFEAGGAALSMGAVGTGFCGGVWRGMGGCCHGGSCGRGFREPGARREHIRL